MVFDSVSDLVCGIKVKTMTENPQLELEVGSGNVFADLQLEDAADLKLKSAITSQINSMLGQLTLAQAAKLLDRRQSEISALMNGKLQAFSLNDPLEIKFQFQLPRDWNQARLRSTAD